MSNAIALIVEYCNQHVHDFLSCQDPSGNNPDDSPKAQ